MSEVQGMQCMAGLCGLTPATYGCEARICMCDVCIVLRLIVTQIETDA